MMKNSHLFTPKPHVVLILFLLDKWNIIYLEVLLIIKPTKFNVSGFAQTFKKIRSLSQSLFLKLESS